MSHLAQTLTPGSHVIVDSTGIKVYGKSEWHQEKHEAKAKRTWRKLHIAVDEKHQIIAYDITLNSIGDTTGAFDLLTQVEHDFKVVMGDGAYDSFALNEAILMKQPDAKIVIPPPSVAVISPEANTQRDEHIRFLDENGRMAWQTQHNYGLRSHIELAILRYKKIIGPAMKARQLPQQKTEGGIGTRALNRMTSLGMPVSVKVK
ncbi:TPA: IS5 family transposase [Legionella pneumophila]